MKVLFILLVTHLFVCCTVIYCFGQWDAASTREAITQTSEEPRGKEEGFIASSASFTDHTFTAPRAVIIYSVAGLLGLFVAFLAELYARFFPAS
jgi:hypothetical protein